MYACIKVKDSQVGKAGAYWGKMFLSFIDLRTIPYQTKNKNNSVLLRPRFSFIYGVGNLVNFFDLFHLFRGFPKRS